MVSQYSIVEPKRSDAVKALTAPHRVRRRTFPKIRYNDQGITDVSQSIRLTLMYLAASIRPYDGGKLVADPRDRDTVIWPLLKHVSRSREQRNANDIIEVVYDTRYLFDADGQLLRQVHTHTRDTKDRRSTRPEVISTDDLDPQLRRKLLEALEKRRFNCQESWKHPFSR